MNNKLINNINSSFILIKYSLLKNVYLYYSPYFQLSNYEKEGNKSTSFTLTVSDNCIGVPENLDIKKLDSFGIQMITTLIDQLDREIELKRDKCTEFVIEFSAKEKEN